MEKITSSENNQFKFLKKLKQKKYREEFSLFLAEGDKFLDFQITPEYIIINEEVLELLKNKIEQKQCRKLVLTKQLFAQLSSQESSQGVILVYKTSYSNLENMGKNLVILDRVADPGNLGTILRLCDASGFKDIILVDGCVDVYNEKVVRSSMGSIFGVNFIYLPEEKIFEFLEKNSYKVFVTALDDSSIKYTEVKLSDKNCFVFGNEGKGVSQDFLNRASEKVIIPIYGIAESLNVAVASGIFLYKMRELLTK